MNYNFELKVEPVRYTLSMRTRTSVQNLPQEIGKAYQTIMQYLNELGEQPSEVPFVAYYNMDMEDLDVEMGFPVSRAISGKNEILANQIPAGKQVSCMYKGPYAECGPAYEEMNKWMSQNGHIPTGAAYEFYYNSPMDVPESELLTKIMFPLK